MKRWLFNLAAGVSMVLCAGTVALWIRSYFALDAFYWLHSGRTRGIVWSSGTVALMSMTEQIGQDPGFHKVSLPPERIAGIADHTEFAGFGYAFESKSGKPGTISILHAPSWFLGAVTLILPMLRWMRYRADKRQIRWSANNFGGNCGYDLRATPDRCPECGTVPAKPHPQPPQPG